MAKKANRSDVVEKQGTMGDMVPKVAEVETAMEAYKKFRDKRMALTEDEVEAKVKLIEVMKKHDLTIYKANGQMVTLTHEEKDDVKVKQTEVDGKGIDE